MQLIRLKSLTPKLSGLLRILTLGQRQKQIRSPLVTFAPQMARVLAIVTLRQPSLRRIFASFCSSKRILAVPSVRVLGAIASDLQPIPIVARSAAKLKLKHETASNLMRLGDDDAKGHRQVVQSDEGLRVHQA